MFGERAERVRVQSVDDTPATVAVPTTGPGALAVIAAVAANGVIGAANRLPWRLPEDLRRFRALTTGHAVIMGRKTWESLPRPLPERQNIVVTRCRDYVAAGAQVAGSLDAALARVTLPAPAYCIGGGELYALALPRADTLYLTEIDAPFDGDAYLPDFDRGDWIETRRQRGERGADAGFDYWFVTYRRAR